MRSAEPTTGPWYREPWPWILLSGPFLVVVLGLIATWVAFSTADALVDDDYYKEGQAINALIKRDARARELQLSARGSAHDGRIEIALVSATRAPLASQLRLLISHAAQPQKDQVVALRLDRAGSYHGAFRPLDHAHYHLTLEDTDRTWRLPGEWDAGADKAPTFRDLGY
jgi:uncharacterized protein